MVVPMVVPAQASEALKSRGLVPVMLTLAMVKAVGPRLTMWMTCAALVAWTSCAPKDSVSGMSTRAGGDAAAAGMGVPVAVGMGVAVIVARGSCKERRALPTALRAVSQRTDVLGGTRRSPLLGTACVCNHTCAASRTCQTTNSNA